MGICAGGEYGVGNFFIAKNFEPPKVARITNIAAIGGQLGAIFAAVMASIIIPKFGWNEIFLVGLISVILVFLVRSHLEESSEFVASKKTDQKKISLGELFTTKAKSYQTIALMFMVVVQIAGFFGLMNLQKQLDIEVSNSSAT